MISKTISTEHGDVSSQAEVHHDDNGQVRLHVVSTLGKAKHEHVVTVGAEDGKDAVADLTEDDLKTSLQKHLDRVRDEAAKVLSGRAKVSKIVGGLS
jgi:hypothetical protein